jgi:hypothetical protein
VKGEEVIGRIGEIYHYIVESKDSLIDAKDEIHDLKDKLHTAEAKLRTADDFDAFLATLTYNEQLGIWKRDLSGVTEAYCGACLNEGKRVRLSRAKTGTILNADSDILVEDYRQISREENLVFQRDLPATLLYSFTWTTIAHARIRGLEQRRYRWDLAQCMSDLWLEDVA